MSSGTLTIDLTGDGKNNSGVAPERVELDGIAGAPVTVNALVRNGVRAAEPSPQTLLAAGDALVLFGSPAGLRRAEETI